MAFALDRSSRPLAFGVCGLHGSGSPRRFFGLVNCVNPLPIVRRAFIIRVLVGDPKRAGRPPFCTTGTTRLCDFSLVHSAAAPVPVSLNRHAFFPINQYLRVVALTKLHPIFCVTILLINYAVSVLVSDCSDDSNDADVCSFASRTLIWLRGNFCLSSKPAFNTPIKVPCFDPNFPSISRTKPSGGRALADGYGELFFVSLLTSCSIVISFC